MVKFSPKLPKRVSENKKEEKITETDTFEWIEFRRSDGEIVKGSVLPPLMKEEVFVSPVEMDEERNHKMYEDVNLAQKKLVAKSNSCDAETQTDKLDKKTVCVLM